MCEIDRIAIGMNRPNLFQMMENAGRSVADTVTDLLGNRWRETPIAVLAGPGSNGGGGIAAARHLANRGGEVTLIFSGMEHSAIQDQQLGVFEDTPGRIGALRDLGTAGVVIDALIGYGLRGEPEGPIAELVLAIGELGVSTVSLDVPSGLNADSGERQGVAVTADVTLTLALPKHGLTAVQAGELWLADLGIPRGVFERVGIDVPVTLFAPGPRRRLYRSNRELVDTVAESAG
jgi:NAD(P)H-hydrate epimerase